jgi:hypothetical protein
MIDTIALLFAITSAVWTGAACGNYLGRELALAWRTRHATQEDNSTDRTDEQ